MSMRTQQPLAPPVEMRGESQEDVPGDLMPIPITVTPATPGVTLEEGSTAQLGGAGEANGEKRSSASLDEKDRDVSRGKKVAAVLKNRVHKGQARITTISKKIGHGVGRHGSLNLKRTTSAPGERT